MNKESLQIQGYCKFQDAIHPNWIIRINEALPDIFKEHERIRVKNNNPIRSEGVAMNVLVGNEIFIEFLQELVDLKIINWIEENYFKEKCILNSFTALSNIPGENQVFHKKIHRDIRGFSSDIPLMLNMLIMLDDFTVENGATLVLPGSHLKESAPTDEEFNLGSIAITGCAGDIIIWNSNLFHASGINTTQQVRRALPITLSLPYYKQLLDYPRAIGYEKSSLFNDDIRKLLGYDSRIPANINEWYAPIDQLLYKK
jgi:ectoine hydroxylase-related dioxygenase (phytanoyl-CoA dioxygenase family)